MTNMILRMSLTLGATLLVLACASTPSTPLADLQTGNYLATTEHTDGEGWAPFLYVVVDDAQSVRQIRFDYFDPEIGTFKTDDAQYGSRMRDTVGLSPTEYAATLTERLKESNTLPVDAISGATISSNWFNLLAERLLPRMQDGDERPVLAPMSARYIARDLPDEQGWIGTISIVTEGRSIQSVDFDEVKLDSAGNIETRKNEPSPGDQDVWTPPHHATMAQLYDALSSQLIDEGRPAGVDVITGATESSQRFRILAATAIESRVPVDFVRLEELVQ